MTGPFLRILMVGLVSAGLPLAATAAEDAAGQEEPASLEELTEIARNSTFIWLEEPEAESQREAMSIREFAAQFDDSILYDGLGGFLLPLDPEEARRSVRAAQEDLSPSRALPKVQLIEPNAVVHAFVSGCGEHPEALPSPEVTPAGVERVNRLAGPASGPFSSRVWVIDSGIAGDFEGTELNVNRAESVKCNPAQCQQADATDDKLGHGTSLAGTIGAVGGNSSGLVGVAPGVELIAVQVFNQSPHVTLKTVYQGIQHVDAEAQSGDVVNISWGMGWNPDPQSDQRKIEVVLVDLAERGVKIAVAAGNNDVMDGSGYVQTVSPARAGAYRQEGGDGAIVTVSAAHSQPDATTGDWTDVFWPHSAFGNGEMDSSGTFYHGPPDFAEPGVDIVSLWPGNGGPGRINTCTGTSFATAHMSGILVAGMPQADGAAAEDPSAKMPDGQFDPAQLDRIGVR